MERGEEMRRKKRRGEVEILGEGIKEGKRWKEERSVVLRCERNSCGKVEREGKGKKMREGEVEGRGREVEGGVPGWLPVAPLFPLATADVDMT